MEEVARGDPDYLKNLINRLLKDEVFSQHCSIKHSNPDAIVTILAFVKLALDMVADEEFKEAGYARYKMLLET